MLSLIKADLSPEYRKYFNVHQLDDFVYLAKDGIKISNQLYREGSIDILKQERYFTLLKQVEEYYDDTITTVKERKPHLSNRQCILNNNGVENYVAKEFDSIYLIPNSCIFSIDKQYYNVETNYCYGKAYSYVESRWNLFLKVANIKYNQVLKIDKITGLSELIS